MFFSSTNKSPQEFNAQLEVCDPQTLLEEPTDREDALGVLGMNGLKQPGRDRRGMEGEVVRWSGCFFLFGELCFLFHVVVLILESFWEGLSIWILKVLDCFFGTKRGMVFLYVVFLVVFFKEVLLCFCYIFL